MSERGRVRGSPVRPEDRELYSSVDYDYLVSQGIYTREEADLQRALDQALVARSVALTSGSRKGEEHER